MRAVVQRVTRASVTVVGAGVDASADAGADQVVGEIDTGLLVLIGVTHDDTVETAAALARKVAGLRILRGERSVAETDGAAILAVSQFTLYGDARKGRRPTWAAAAPGPVAKPLFDAVVAGLRAAGVPVQTGVFGADMRVELVNDGPTTLLLEF